MANLNMADEEEPQGRPSVVPMMAGRSTGGGGFFRIVIILVVVLGLGGGGFYLYKSGKIPFLSPKNISAPTEVVPPSDQTIQTPTPTTLPPEPATTIKQEPTKVTPEPTPIKREQTIGTGDYTVVIASFQSKQTADEEAARWSSAGFQTTVPEKQVDGETWYRVCIGRYETHQLATKAAKEMEHMFETGYWVNKVQ